jgi:hypothetical protein
VEDQQVPGSPLYVRALRRGDCIIVDENDNADFGVKGNVSPLWLIFRCPTLTYADFADMLEPVYAGGVPTELVALRARYFDLDTLLWAQRSGTDSFVEVNTVFAADLMAAKRTYPVAQGISLG